MEVESIYSGVELDLGFVVALVIFSSSQALDYPNGGCCYLVLRVGPGGARRFFSMFPFYLVCLSHRGISLHVAWIGVGLLVGTGSSLLHWSSCSLRQLLCAWALGLRFSQHYFLSSPWQPNSALCLWLVLGRTEFLVSHIAEADLCLASVQNPGPRKISCLTPEMKGFCFCPFLISNRTLPGPWGQQVVPPLMCVHMYYAN